MKLQRSHEMKAQGGRDRLGAGEPTSRHRSISARRPKPPIDGTSRVQTTNPAPTNQRALAAHYRPIRDRLLASETIITAEHARSKRAMSGRRRRVIRLPGCRSGRTDKLPTPRPYRAHAADDGVTVRAGTILSAIMPRTRGIITTRGKSDRRADPERTLPHCRRAAQVHGLLDYDTKTIYDATKAQSAGVLSSDCAIAPCCAGPRRKPTR